MCIPFFISILQAIIFDIEAFNPKLNGRLLTVEYQRSVFPNEQASGDMDGNLMMRHTETVTNHRVSVIGTVQEGEVYAYVSTGAGRDAWRKLAWVVGAQSRD